MDASSLPIPISSAQTDNPPMIFLPTIVGTNRRSIYQHRRHRPTTSSSADDLLMTSSSTDDHFVCWRPLLIFTKSSSTDDLPTISKYSLSPIVADAHSYTKNSSCASIIHSVRPNPPTELSRTWEAFLAVPPPRILWLSAVGLLSTLNLTVAPNVGHRVGPRTWDQTDKINFEYTDYTDECVAQHIPVSNTDSRIVSAIGPSDYTGIYAGRHYEGAD